MALIAIERDRDRIRWTDDGATVQDAPSLGSLAERLPGPTVVLCQPSFFDADPILRRWLERDLAGQGHTLVVLTAGALSVLGDGAGAATHGPGVRGLLSSATAGSARLDHTTGAGRDWYAVRDALDAAHALAVATRRHPALDDALAVLGPYAALEVDARLALGDGEAYRVELLLAVALAATVATNRDDFERFLGLSARHAQGSMSRAVHGWYAARNTGPDGFARESALTWSAYRRALRWAYHRITSARRHPEAGPTRPASASIVVPSQEGHDAAA